MRKQLTEIMVEKRGAPAAGRVEIFDTIVPALALRITANGARSFAVRARVKGHSEPIRVTLGDARAMKLTDARRQASDVLQACRAGRDPREERRQQKVEADRTKLEAERTEALRWESVVASFVEKHAKRNRTWKQTEAVFRNHCTPRWKGRMLSGVSRADVVALLDWIEGEVSAYQANRVLAAVRKLFNWAVLRGMLDSTPIVKGMAREGEEARTRFLTFDEIRLVWRAAQRIGYPFGPLFQLLLATGQRRSEVASMRWAALDLDRERVWTLTPEDTKAGREHLLPLVGLALDALRRLPRINDPATGQPTYVLTTTGSAAVSGFSKAKAALGAQMAKLAQEEADGEPVRPVPEWRLHDLRRTVATHMEDALGIPPHIVGSVLNHAPAGYKGVTSIYTRGSLIFERRRALTAWSRLLALVIEGGEAWQRVASILRPETEADAAQTMEFRRMAQADEATWTAYLATLAGQDAGNVVRLAV